ncbi:MULTISPECIES: hypothetical protein [Streptomyces]|uniref:Uncharacterized protein n=2 Tax=Streptomyces TaxID=1883 RepID=A0AB39S8G5_9ACTN|nr:hypothetical protein OG324_23090 [Streptomyces sp. NBC_01236]
MSFHKIAPVKKHHKPAAKHAAKPAPKPAAKKAAAPKPRPVSRQGR